MKLTLAVVLTLAAALIGRGAAMSLLERTKRLREMADGIGQLRIRSLAQMQPLAQALAESGEPVFVLVGQEMRSGDAYAAWRRASGRQNGKALSWMQRQEAEVLDRLFSDLGQSGQHALEAAFSAARREILRIAAESERESSGKVRLYATLGALAGLAASVLAL